jgi:hypothetical protein
MRAEVLLNMSELCCFFNAIAEYYVAVAVATALSIR